MFLANRAHVIANPLPADSLVIYLVKSHRSRFALHCSALPAGSLIAFGSATPVLLLLLLHVWMGCHFTFLTSGI